MGKPYNGIHNEVNEREVSAGLFQTLQVKLKSGRFFTDADTAGKPKVIVINQAFAQRYFPGEDPIGQRYKDAYDGKWRTIVGVVASVKNQQPMNPPIPGVYAPYAQSPGRWMWITVRARGDAAQLTDTARTAVGSLDHDLPLLKVRTMSEVVSDSLSAPRLLMQCLAGFAIFALLLDAIGIYGIVEYSVRQRKHEMGIRVALGASYSNVVTLVLRRGTLPAAVGVLLGLPVALAASGVLRTLLYGISPRDLTVFAGVPVILLIIALGASFLPARRAAKVDPIIALRCE